MSSAPGSQAVHDGAPTGSSQNVIHRFYPPLASISTHFSKYRATALGIAMVGSGIGRSGYRCEGFQSLIPPGRWNRIPHPSRVPVRERGLRLGRPGLRDHLFRILHDGDNRRHEWNPPRDGFREGSRPLV